MMVFFIITGVGIILLVWWLVAHQKKLRLRAHLMQEAIRNHDFTFRLPTDGLLPGERAMQQGLNQLGNIIRQQVNQNEVEAWERLTRVLTHEIMNATAPIASISQSLLKREDVKGTPIEEGIHAIHTTSLHLSAFVDSYRKLSLLQEPRPEVIRLKELADDLPPLYPELGWQVQIDPETTVKADANMLRQILINLTKNALEAGARHMNIEATRKDEELCIAVSNDGQPIPVEARSSIFVPFFTTKRTGNGIGLSLSRRMMTQQGGSLELADRPLGGYHTTFLLLF